MNAEPMPSIVVGVDGSKASILALRWAGVIAPLMNAEIRAVTAWDFDVPFPLMAPAAPNPDRAAERTCSLAVEQAYGTTAPAPVNQVIRRGAPAKVLMDESLTAQLLILGSSDHGHMKELLMGSVSTLAAQQAKCPVLIAHGTELPAALMPAAAAAPVQPANKETRRE